MSTTTLLPCPFCGQRPTEYAIEPHTHVLQFAGAKMPDHPGSHVIECACGCGMIEATREEVIATWNRRPTQAAASPVVLPEPMHREWRFAFQKAIDTMAIEADVRPDEEDQRQMRRAIAILRALLATGGEAQAQQPAIMPKGESAAAQLRTMATNYPTGHSWDKLDAKVCIRGALEIEALRAQLATATGLPAQADMPDSFREWFAKNYPADTIIVDPEWHAKSIFRMAQAHARLAGMYTQDAVTQAVRDYYFALDTHQHGGVAAGVALGAIQKVLNLNWVQGAEASTRAVMAASKGE
ncbi:Lar family restriction alleviation protein [Comamonas thiooxydans]|uniref:Lar family restriction alleviation protein n=1 Tax=Comamonas sp. wu1-DMT TaxID=3126390 RepID=UPI00242C3A25|nr:Lar family restriction alleviation protein [Comamonas thiooxydans]